MQKKWPKIAQNGPFWSQNGFKWSKTTVFQHFWGRENQFWSYQVEFRDQNTIFGDNLR